jgi:aminopeptidase N
LPEIVISPIPGGFGQGFPGLVYASTLSYFRADDPPLKGYSSDLQLFYTHLLLSHEIAHQWWGNVVTTYSPSNVWIMEALASYSALLFLEHERGRAAMDRVLDQNRAFLLQKNEADETIESAGAIVLGERLRTSQFPSAMQTVVYDKGAWILHMLRGLMGDDKFFAFLRSLCEDFQFEDLTVEAFQRQAARFIPEDRPDRELRNFFDQWVYNTGIPALDIEYTSRADGGRFEFSAILSQTGVPEWFSIAVPVEIHTAPGRSLLKWVATEGAKTHFQVILQNRPSRVVVDPQLVVLRQPPS